MRALLIDGGQSGCRAAVVDHGRTLASGDLDTLLRGPGSDGHRGGETFANLEALFMHHTKRSLRD